MRSKIWIFFYSLILLLLISCDKDEFETRQSIRIVNYTEFSIDTVKIWLYGEHVRYENIDPMAGTDFKSMIDLPNESNFMISINDTTISRGWNMPILERSEIVPTQISSPSPTGYYTFGVFSLDSTLSSLFIGLVDYRIYL